MTRFVWVLIGICLTTVHGETVFPKEVLVFEGEEAFFRFQDPIDNMTSCSVRTPPPDLQSYTLWPKQESERLVYMGNGKDTCGVRIKDISPHDIGFWVLTAPRPNVSEARGTTKIAVTNVTIDVDFSHDVIEGSTLNLTVDRTGHEYCDIRRPSGDSASEYFTGHCWTILNTTSNADSGQWSALVGIPGKVEEEKVEGFINVYDHTLYSGVSQSTATQEGVNLFCNYLFLGDGDALNVCRFIRPDGTGLRMDQGVGNGQYSYFGEGFKKGDCGLSIEDPDEQDYGTWRCMVRVWTARNESFAIESSIYFTSSENSVRTLDIPIESHVPILLGSETELQCYAVAALRYCTIISPEGDELAGIPSRLSSGACAITLRNVTSAHNGTWQCLMGSSQESIEQRQILHVRVTDTAVAASVQQISAQLGDTIQLMCRSVELVDTSRSSANSSSRPAIKYCRFIRPDGSVFAVEEGNDPGGRYWYFGEGFSRGQCGLEISNASVEDKGQWKCAAKLDFTMYNEREFSDNINLTISGSGEVFPAWVLVLQGDDAILQMTSAVTDQSRCSIRLPNGVDVDLGSGTHPGLSYWGSGLKNGGCGVRIDTKQLDSSNQGYEQWTLISEDTKGNKEEGSSWVSIASNGTRVGKETPTIFTDLGGSLDIKCVEELLESSTYCIVLPPSSDPTHYVPGACFTHVEYVTHAHLGEWSCIIGRSDTTVETLNKIRVVLNDVTLLTNYEPIGNTEGALHCHVRHAISFCRFMTPEGQGLRIGDGLARGRYSYTGSGLQAGDCGIRIQDMTASDYGSWRCYVGLTSQDVQMGFVKVSKNKDSDEVLSSPLLSPSQATSVVGSELTISCKTTASLSYCWFRHPNGSTLTPTSAGLGPINAEFCYEGAGLQSGECGVTIKRAGREDSGEWECHMGIIRGEELVQRVVARIAETPLMAESRTLTSSKGSALNLKCMSVPSGSSLDYCRFLREDGVGVHVQNDLDFDFVFWGSFHPDAVNGRTTEDRYLYSGKGLDVGECGLHVKKAVAVDFGTWTCAAKVQGQTIEAHDTISVTENALTGGAITGITLSSLLILGVIVAPVIFLIKRRRSNRERMQQSETSSTSSSEDTVLNVIRQSYGSDALASGSHDSNL